MSPLSGNFASAYGAPQRCSKEETQIMTYRDIWRRIAAVNGESEAKAVARALLEDGYGMSYTDIISDAVEKLGDRDTAKLEADVARLERGEPVQYVTGRADFMGRIFHVAPSVLVPRPETEKLCTLVADSLPHDGKEKHILDIGTGSGCIATTLALEVKGARVTAWDISADALEIARCNAARLEAEVDFCQQDALNPPDDHCVWDAVVSNPPYVCMEERSEMDCNVLDYEPALALFVPDDDPLVFYRSIAHYAVRSLKPNGLLAFEINRRFAAEMEQMLRAEGFRDVHTVRDIFGNYRNTICRR